MTEYQEEGSRESGMDAGVGRSQWWDVWNQFMAHRGALAGMIIFSLIVFAVLAGPPVYWNDPQFVPAGRDFIELRDTRPIYVTLWDADAKIDWMHPLGTDNLGRDSLARLPVGGPRINCSGFHCNAAEPRDRHCRRSTRRLLQAA